MPKEVKLYTNLVCSNSKSFSLKSILEAIRDSDQVSIKETDSEIWYLPKGKSFINNDLLELDNGSKILPFTYMEGPVLIYSNSAIGPCAYLRPGSIVGPSCKIGHSVELYRAIIGMNTMISHRAYVGHSYIGRDSLIGAGFVAAVKLKRPPAKFELRHYITKQILSSIVIEKLGVVTQSNVWIGCGIVTLPGTFIPKGSKIKIEKSNIDEAG